MAFKMKGFKAHNMYDPKTGKAYLANTFKDHLRMKKKGYTHSKPNDKKS
tara:strand:- start:514 stop:660 length:147 start_codon:yes stop_codon:yes gene_type:complete